MPANIEATVTSRLIMTHGKGSVYLGAGHAREP